MKQGKKQLNRLQKRKLLKTFLIASGTTLTLCVLAIIAVSTFYNQTVAVGTESQVVIKPEELTEEEIAFEEEKHEVSEVNKTIAVFGVDEDEVRTDVIFVVNFNTLTNKVKVVSIPRDTKVFWTDKQKKAYNQLTGYSISISKINEMSARGRINENVGNIRDFTIDEIENILRVHIDSYVVINLDAFKEIVAAMGGVDMYVPQDMYYQDRSQGLYINLKEGMQHLDEEDAEGLVRFRRYPRGDEARVEVQQLFLKAVAEKVMNQDVASLVKMATRLYSYVKTDIQLNEVLEYLDLLKQFNLSNLTFNIVPGVGASYEGPSYYYIDQEKLDQMIIDVFADTTVAEEAGQTEVSQSEAPQEPVVDKAVSIAIYNATDIKGVAGKYKELLEKEGYSVDQIDNYNQNDLTNSVIYAKDTSKAEQFKTFISGADIKQDDAIEHDIEIVIGKASANVEV